MIRWLDQYYAMMRWPRMYVLDEAGEPLVCEDLLAWGDWMGQNKRRVASTVIDGNPPVRVSTVFLGLDHNFVDAGDPVLWESMVFGGPLDGEQDRYTSKDDAVAGHAAMCDRVRATLPTRE